MCISWINKGLNTVNMHGATTKIILHLLYNENEGGTSPQPQISQTNAKIYVLQSILNEPREFWNVVLENYRKDQFDCWWEK